MPPTTLRDLIESNVRVADATLGQTAAINRQANALERLIPRFEQLAHDIYDIKNSREMDQAKLDLAVGKLNTDLVLLLDNVRHAQSDVRELQRDVTSPHLRLPPPDNRSSAEKMIDRFERMSTATKLWVLALVLTIVVGFGLHLILAAAGVGG